MTSHLKPPTHTRLIRFFALDANTPPWKNRCVPDLKLQPNIRLLRGQQQALHDATLPIEHVPSIIIADNNENKNDDDDDDDDDDENT